MKTWLQLPFTVVLLVVVYIPTWIISSTYHVGWYLMKLAWKDGN